VFRVPTTHDVLTSLFDPRQPKSHLDAVTLITLFAQIGLFLVLPRSVSQKLFVVYFAFWRTAYDAGLGWVLTQQSKKRWIVREVKKRGWMDKSRRPKVAAWIQKQLEGKMGKDYDFDVSTIRLPLLEDGGLIETADYPHRVQHLAHLPSVRGHHPSQVSLTVSIARALLTYGLQ